MKVNKSRIILIAVAVVLVAVLAALVIVALGDLADRQNNQPQETTVSTTQPPVGDDQIVETPYGKLVFPGEWEDYLLIDRVEEPDLTISFSAKLPSGKNHDLFTIRFGEAVEPAVGQVLSSEGVAVGVHVTMHPFNPDGSWSVKDTEVVSDMLECLNPVLEGLNMVPVGTPIPEINGDEMSIDTPYCKLYFPTRWLEELRITVDETDGYDVMFKAVIGEHKAVKLFAVNFGGSEAMGKSVHTLKTENDVPFSVRLRTFELNLEGWGTVDQSTIRSMQEDLNHLLEKLIKE